MLQIQMGCANQIDRKGKGKRYWETVAMGDTHKVLIENFLQALNSDEVINSNSFFRLVTRTGKIKSF